MKILMAAGWYFPESAGGTELYVEALARGLVARGEQAVVAAPWFGGELRRDEWKGVPVVRYPVAEHPSREEAAGLSLPQGLELFERMIAEERPDIVHFHSWTRGCGLRHMQAARPLTRRMMLTVHTTLCPRETMMKWGREPCDGELLACRCASCVLQKKGLPRPLSDMVALVSRLAAHPGAGSGRLGTAWRLEKNLERQRRDVRRLWNMLDRVVAVCEWGRKALIRNGCPESKITLSRQGLVEEPAADDSQRRGSDGFRIGYLGRYDPLKGVHVLVDAFLKLPVSSAISLDLLGLVQNRQQGDYLAMLKQKASGHPHIHFLEPTSREQVHAFIKSLDALAVPSIGLETGPMVVLEALVAGVPVLGSDLGGIAELIKDGKNGWLVGAGDVSAWTVALERAADGRAELGRLEITGGRVRTMASVVEEMAALYSQP